MTLLASSSVTEYEKCRSASSLPNLPFTGAVKQETGAIAICKKLGDLREIFVGREPAGIC